MSDLRPLLRRAAIRLAIVRFLSTLATTTTLAIGALALLLLIYKFTALPVDWSLAMAAAAGAAIGGAAVWTWLRRPSEVGIARVLDDRAGLREVLSTALFVRDRTDAWSRAAVEHARGAAKRVVVRDAVPIRAPRRWAAPAIALALFGGLWLVPQADLLGLVKKAEAQEQERRERVEAEEQVDDIEAELKEALSKLEDPSLEAELEAKETGAELQERSPDEIRREAVKKLTKVQDRLEQMKSGEKAKQLEALRERMNKLRRPGPGPMDEVAKAMQSGDFKKARAALEELAEKLASGELSEADKKALQEQMKKLGEQLEQLARQQEELEKKLEELGLDKKLASDPEALERALEKMEGLSNEQKKQLGDMAKANAAAGEMCNGMAGALGRNGQGMLGSLDALGDQLSQAEMLAQEMALADAALNSLSKGMNSLGECMGGGMKGMFAQGKGGQGKRGQGQGAPGQVEEAPSQRVSQKSPSKTGEGPIVGSTFVQGAQVRGESRAQFGEVVDSGQRAAAEAIENNTIPREHQDAIKRYFGRLKSQVEKERLESAGAGEGASDESSSK